MAKTPKSVSTKRREPGLQKEWVAPHGSPKGVGPFSAPLAEHLDPIHLLGEEAHESFLQRFEYLQNEYLKSLYADDGDIYFVPEYQLTIGDAEHPDHYALIRLMASMVGQCQPDKAPNLSEDDFNQLSHISGR